MQSFKEQIQSIKAKLNQAKTKDQDLQIFGAASHQYLIHQPLQMEEIVDFEKRYRVSLPDSYKAYLLELGNGGPSFADSAAGPFYGIYPFGENLIEIGDAPYEYLSKEAIVAPDMTDEAWETHAGKLSNEELYAGILPLGSQGCSYLHGIILNGPYKGRVVNLDLDGQKPKFSKDTTFLNWYERWLDEIISSPSLADAPIWFGYDE